MPEVGRVTEVAPVVRRERALVAEKVMTSPPPSVMELVARVVESETVSVLAAPKVRIPVPVVMVLPLKEEAVIAPKVELPVLRDVENRLVELAVVEKKLVVVAEVPVAVLKVKFWMVVEPAR